jgi:hypothetical protein
MWGSLQRRWCVDLTMRPGIVEDVSTRVGFLGNNEYMTDMRTTRLIDVSPVDLEQSQEVDVRGEDKSRFVEFLTFVLRANLLNMD